MDRDEFVAKMMFNERVKLIRKNRNKDRIIKTYRSERIFEDNKGKPDTYRMINVNYDR